MRIACGVDVYLVMQYVGFDEVVVLLLGADQEELQHDRVTGGRGEISGILTVAFVLKFSCDLEYVRGACHCMAIWRVEKVRMRRGWGWHAVASK